MNYVKVTKEGAENRIILVRIGEIALKGLNRSTFEKNLYRNLKEKLKDHGNPDIHWSQSRFYIVPTALPFDYESATEAASSVFGVVSSSLALACKSDFEEIKAVVRRIDGEEA